MLPFKPVTGMRLRMPTTKQFKPDYYVDVCMRVIMSRIQAIIRGQSDFYKPKLTGPTFNVMLSLFQRLLLLPLPRGRHA